MNLKVIGIAALVLVSVLYITNRPQNSTQILSDLSDYEVATFAGGCFWCMEAAFEATNGVVEAVSGYTGGHTANPTYEQVLTKTTGHLEAVQVYYDPGKVTYSELLDVYWRNIDPTDDKGQFFDKGAQYLTTIFYGDEEQRIQAEQSKQELELSDRFSDPIVTEIIEFDVFYNAEEYHQDYYKKQVFNYKLYSSASGREEFQKEFWGE
jgi:peptide methionine sulfoxide reductase msrA/msrB